MEPGRIGRGGVVCGVDESGEAAEVVATARRLAGALGVPVVLVHVGADPVVWPPVTAGMATPSGAMDDLHAAMAAGARRSASVHADADPAPDEYARTMSGDPSEVLSAEAERLDAMLLVVGSRRRGPRAGAVLGSVSADLLARSRRPVVVVPHGAPLRPRHDGSTVLCGVAGRQGDDGALASAAALAEALGARLLLGHAAPEATLGPSARAEAARLMDGPSTDRRRAAGGVLAAAAERHGLTDHAELRVVAGPAIEALGGLAAEEDVDLLVVGGRRRGAVRRATVGDAGIALIEAARCPVMVVPDPQ